MFYYTYINTYYMFRNLIKPSKIFNHNINTVRQMSSQDINVKISLSLPEILVFTSIGLSITGAIMSISNSLSTITTELKDLKNTYNSN